MYVIFQSMLHINNIPLLRSECDVSLIAYVYIHIHNIYNVMWSLWLLTFTSTYTTFRIWCEVFDCLRLHPHTQHLECDVKSLIAYVYIHWWRIRNSLEHTGHISVPPLPVDTYTAQFSGHTGSRPTPDCHTHKGCTPSQNPDPRNSPERDDKS